MYRIRFEDVQDGQIAKFDMRVPRNTSAGDSDFMECIAFNKNAAYINKYVNEADYCELEGSLQFDKWVDRSGNQKKKPLIYVNFFKKVYVGESQQTQNPEGISSESKEEPKPEDVGIEIDDGDIVLPY